MSPWGLTLAPGATRPKMYTHFCIQERMSYIYKQMEKWQGLQNSSLSKFISLYSLYVIVKETLKGQVHEIRMHD